MSQVCCWARTWQKQGRIQFLAVRSRQFPEFFPIAGKSAASCGKSRALVAAPRTYGIAQRIAGSGSGGAWRRYGRRTGPAASVVPRTLLQLRRCVLLIVLCFFVHSRLI